MKNKNFLMTTACSILVAFSATTITTAKAQVYTLQPSVSSSLGNAAGAALSGNYNSPTTTMYLGNNTSMYRNNQVYGGPDYVASFFGQRDSQKDKIEEEQKKQEENDAPDTHELDQTKIKLEKTKKEQMLLNQPPKEAPKAEEKNKENKQKQNSYYIDNSVPLSVIGKAKAIDGITMMIGNTIVILHGLTAPGNGQMCNGNGVQYDCGNRVRENLSDLVDNKIVVCTGWGNYGMCVSQKDGTNINNYVIKQGIVRPK